MTPLEAKEIRGLSIKSIFWLVSCTVTIMLSILTSYFSLKAQIREVQVSKDSDSRYNDLRMKVLEQKVDVLDIQLKEIKESKTP